jgi:hypothetical protein
LAGGIDLWSYAGDNPVQFVDPLGLDWTDIYAGFGDTLTSGFGLTYLFGLPSGTEWIRQQFGVDDVVDKCSGWYTGGKYAGYAWLGAITGALGVTPFAEGGIEWHIGLELSGARSLIHMGYSAQWGYHLALGYVGPMAAYLHFYLDPWYPFFVRPWVP